MNYFLLWISGALIGVGVSLGIYATYLDTGVKCLEKYNTADEIASCVDILND